MSKGEVRNLYCKFIAWDSASITEILDGLQCVWKKISPSAFYETLAARKFFFMKILSTNLTFGQRIIWLLHCQNYWKSVHCQEISEDSPLAGLMRQHCPLACSLLNFGSPFSWKKFSFFFLKIYCRLLMFVFIEDNAKFRVETVLTLKIERKNYWSN